MLLDLKNKEHYICLCKYGKAYGTILLNKWLPSVCRIKNMFIIDNYEEFQKISDQFPETLICRADARMGDKPVLRNKWYAIT